MNEHPGATCQCKLQLLVGRGYSDLHVCTAYCDAHCLFSHGVRFVQQYDMEQYITQTQDVHATHGARKVNFLFRVV